MRRETVTVETFAGTVAKINTTDKDAWVDGEPADYDDTVAKMRATVENDEADRVEGPEAMLLVSGMLD